MIIAVNMMDVVEKTGDKIDVISPSKVWLCSCRNISFKRTESPKPQKPLLLRRRAVRLRCITKYSNLVEEALADIEQTALTNIPERNRRWYSIKIFERDEKVLKQSKCAGSFRKHRKKINEIETERDDDAESIITAERYDYISGLVKSALLKSRKKRFQFQTR